jgi:hypothetical protein
VRPVRRFQWLLPSVAGVLLSVAVIPTAVAQPFLTGPWLATGQIDDVEPPVFRGDSAEIITGPGVGGPPLVKIFRVTQAPPSSGTPVGPGFLAYEETFLGGVRVATCDFAAGAPPLPPNPQPTRQILTGPGPGMEPRVRVFSVDHDGLTPTLVADFLAFDPAFTGGVFVACGDVDGDGVDEIIAGSGAGNGALVRVFQLDPGGFGIQIAEFAAFNPAPTGGVRVAAGDLDGDCTDEVIVGRGSGPAQVRVFQVLPSVAVLFDFLAFPSVAVRKGAGGVFVASARLGGIDRDSIITGSGPGFPDRIRTFRLEAGSLVMTLNKPLPARHGAPAKTGIVVTGGTLTAALDSEIVYDRYAGGSTRVRSIFFIGTTGRVNFEAY